MQDGSTRFLVCWGNALLDREAKNVGASIARPLLIPCSAFLRYIEAVLCPFHRIANNIIPYLIIVRFIADYVVME
mgnify:CR=1 FL=1